MKYPKDYFLTHRGKALNFSQIKKACPTCSSDFMVQKYREKTAKFCSVKCNKGYKLSEETKKKMSQSRLGEKHPNFGKKASPELIKKLKDSHKGKFTGKNNPNWKGNTSIKKQIRTISNYYEWREKIFIRDNFTCQLCGISGEYLHADHIKPFAKIIDEYKIKSFEDAIECKELWNTENGRSLCVPCHKETDTYAGRSG